MSRHSARLAPSAPAAEAFSSLLRPSWASLGAFARPVPAARNLSAGSLRPVGRVGPLDRGLPLQPRCTRPPPPPRSPCSCFPLQFVSTLEANVLISM